MAWILLPQRAGNTSACAEKSSASTRNGEPARKYLRVCGEEIGLANVVSLCPEIPPRVRRRGTPERDLTWGEGNTSACAEKRRQ